MSWTRGCALAVTAATMLRGEAALTLSAEARVRMDAYANARMAGGDYRQGLFRGILGADLRLDSHVRLHGEAGTGQVQGRRGAAGANFQNGASLQQLFAEVSGQAGGTRVDVMAGRLEFADGPRQLISPGDGPNLHRSWNGLRLHAQGRRLRAGAFDLRATRLARGAFDETIDPGERLRGLNASLELPPGGGTATFLEPFWFHTEKPGFRAGGQVGLDDRDTFGLRLRGRRGGLAFDWTLAHQSGRHLKREIDAWGLFAVQSLVLSAGGWKPTLTAHLDLATGGAYGTGSLKAFDPLYASSGYLGEGQFLGLSNLAMIAPGLSVAPSSGTTLSAEYGFARRLETRDAAYAGGLRAYAGTRNVPGHDLGGLLRVMGTWSACANLTLFFNYEHFAAGAVLTRARLRSGSYAYAGATFRY